MDAIKYCEKSLEYFDGSRNVAQFRKVEVLLGDLYTKFGSTYEAISLYERGLERAEELGDVYSQSFYCNQLTRVNISLEIMDNAELYSGKALALVDLVRPRAPLQVANSYNNKGHLMLLKGQKDSAQVYWHKAMDIYEMLPYTLGNESLDLDFGKLLVCSGTFRKGRLTPGGRTVASVERTIDAVLLPMMKKSDNLAAESMFYQLAARSGKPYAGRREAVRMG